MSDLPRRLRPNTGEVAAKVIDGEAILIRLPTGAYYSMRDVGSAIWEAIEAGLDLDAITARLALHFEVEVEQAGADVERIASELLAECLVLPCDEDTPPASQAEDAAPAERRPYASPVLEAYADMGDLLALDPPGPSIEEIPWKE